MKGNCNITSYDAILDICVLSTLCQQFGEDPHMALMTRFPQTFGHIGVHQCERMRAIYCSITTRAFPDQIQYQSRDAVSEQEQGTDAVSVLVLDERNCWFWCTDLQ